MQLKVMLFVKMEIELVSSNKKYSIFSKMSFSELKFELEDSEEEV